MLRGSWRYRYRSSHSRLRGNRHHAAEAASYLFEECYRQGILTSEFFLDDDRFFGKVALAPNAKLRSAFFAAKDRAQRLARKRASGKPRHAARSRRVCQEVAHRDPAA
jgi:hypothetical protein